MDSGARTFENRKTSRTSTYKTKYFAQNYPPNPTNAKKEIQINRPFGMASKNSNQLIKHCECPLSEFLTAFFCVEDTHHKNSTEKDSKKNVLRTSILRSFPKEMYHQNLIPSKHCQFFQTILDPQSINQRYTKKTQTSFYQTFHKFLRLQPSQPWYKAMDDAGNDLCWRNLAKTRGNLLPQLFGDLESAFVIHLEVFPHLFASLIFFG